MLGNVRPVILIFVAVVGGIYAGVFKPTATAAVGAAGTLLVALFSGEMSWGRLSEAILSTASSSAMIFLIILGAGIYNNSLSLTQLPHEASAWVGVQGHSPWLVLTIVLLMYLLFGCVMDTLSMVLLTAAIIFPIMSVLDFGMSANDFGLWFSILVLIVVEVGLITPPVGLNPFHHQRDGANDTDFRDLQGRIALRCDRRHSGLDPCGFPGDYALARLGHRRNVRRGCNSTKTAFVPATLT